MTGQGKKIDISKMVRGPYQPCPQCGENTFGILSVKDKHYKRRCRREECWHTSDALRLPAVHKRIIYLDQFAISEMAKTQDATLLRSPKRSVEPCWREISLKIQLLVGAQMIVCPASTCHFNESLVDSSFDALKTTYEGVAAGVVFLSPEEILIRQICRGLQGWLTNRPSAPLTMKDVTTGKIHAWKDLVGISPNLDWSSMKEPLRNIRNVIHESLCNSFFQWQKDQEWTFDDWVREETFGVGRGLCVSFGNAVEALPQQPERLGEVMQHPMNRVLGILHDAGIPSNGAYEKLADFFRSEVFSEIPSVKISALMFAAVARQTAHLGRKEPPDQGFGTDVSAIAAFLPYCDAMLIDNKCRAILADNPVQDRLGFKTKLYSKANVNEFIAFLNETAATMTAELESALWDVNGNDFMNRFKAAFPVK